MQQLSQEGLTPEQLIDGLPQFMARISELNDALGIDLGLYQADHIAVRINEFTVAQQAHQQWLLRAKEWSNTEINGRPIIALGFDEPICAGEWEIECLELPYPGNKTYPEQGWEHIEWVIPCDAQTPEQFLDVLFEIFPKLAQRWDQLSNNGIKVKLSSPQGEHERLANPTVAFKKNGVCIKLHPHSLKAVIESEQE
ncbi:VOC family protein [Vibrio sp. Of7-15]|uniref:VOC family protein n=1 Tax=Vibrio sp. Of7-15 TaxID=2724879 RepID=UPI001EF1A7AF|nr:VOC family protein [Vibrio sp. Of7-15]MCG7495802.1 VOC family protein [Vibrio sp. Of7-15]